MNAWETLLWGDLALTATDYGGLFAHFTVLSLLAIGGAITTVPEMQRYIVTSRAWLDEAQFNGAIALAQAAPGPNVIFVAVIGFQVGGLLGALVTTSASLLPSTVLAMAASRYGEQRREARAVRAFIAGLAPVTIGLLVATSWVLTEPTRHLWSTWLLVGAAVMWMTRTKRSSLWIIAAGAGAGVAGWV